MTYEERTQDEGQQVGMAGDQRSRDREMKKKVKEGTKEREKDGEDWGTSIVLSVFGGHLGTMSTERIKSVKANKFSVGDSIPVPVSFWGTKQKRGDVSSSTVENVSLRREIGILQIPMLEGANEQSTKISSNQFLRCFLFEPSLFPSSSL